MKSPCEENRVDSAAGALTSQEHFEFVLKSEQTTARARELGGSGFVLPGRRGSPPNSSISNFQVFGTNEACSESGTIVKNARGIA